MVIGAGASGLAAAQALRGRGIPVRIIERANRAGDAWYHRHPQLRLNTHRQMSILPGLAIPKATGAFPSRDSIIHYLGDYAARLDAPIDYGVEVTRIDRTRSSWVVTTRAGDVKGDGLLQFVQCGDRFPERRVGSARRRGNDPRAPTSRARKVIRRRKTTPKDPLTRLG